MHITCVLLLSVNQYFHDLIYKQAKDSLLRKSQIAELLHDYTKAVILFPLTSMAMVIPIRKERNPAKPRRDR